MKAWMGDRTCFPWELFSTPCSQVTGLFREIAQPPFVSSWSIMILLRSPRLIRSFPPEIDRIASRAIAKDPDQRYQTGMEMASDIRQLRERCGLIAYNWVNYGFCSGTKSPEG